MATCNDQITTADTGGVELRYIEEDCWGEDMASGKLKKMRFTSESLGVDRDTVVSDEINSDRQISDLIPTNFSASGDINCELSRSTYDDFIASALGGQWDELYEMRDSHSVANVSVNTAKRLVYPVTDAPGVAVGDVITTSGFDEAVNNGTFKVSIVSTQYVTVQPLSGGTDSPLVEEAGSATKEITTKISSLPGVSIWSKDSGYLIYTSETVRDGANLLVGNLVKLYNFATDANNVNVLVTAPVLDGTSYGHTILHHSELTGESNVRVGFLGSRITNGGDEISFYIEKEFTDIADGSTKRILSYSGMMVDRMSISVEAEAKTTVAFSFMGKTGATRTSTLLDDPEEATTTDVLTSTAKGATYISWEDSAGDTQSIDDAVIRSLTLDVANNLRNKTAIGTLGSIDVGQGRFSATGTFSMYLRDFNLYERYLSNDSFAIMFTIGDMDNDDCYGFYMPRVKITNSSIVAGGPDQDVMVDIGYQALRGDTDDADRTLYISKVA